jgi:hypothetical protein
MSHWDVIPLVVLPSVQAAVTADTSHVTNEVKLQIVMRNVRNVQTWRFT